MLVLTAGPALAVTKSGGSGNDTLRGTEERDVLSGDSGDGFVSDGSDGVRDRIDCERVTRR